MAVPYTFGTATSAIPLSQLDSNFATAITIGNTAVQLGNTVTTLNNMTLANVTISSGTITITNVSVTTANVSGTANISTLVVVGNETVGGNTTITGNITAANANVTTNLVLSGGTANGVAYLNGSKVLTTGTALVFDGTNLGIGETTPTQKIHLKGSSTTYGLAETTGTGTSSGFRMKAGASADYTLYTTQGTNQFAIYDNVASSIRFIVDSTGNVGIGTSSPTARLSVIAASANSTAATIGGIEYGGSKRGLTIKTFNSAGGDDCGVEFNAANGLAGYGAFKFAANTTTLATLDASGGLKTLNTIGVGNATPSTSGAGITFPATQSASSDANTLDDYEEGSWTYDFTATTGTITKSATYLYGYYTKVGRVVTITGFLQVASVSSPTGVLTLTGLPFPIASTGSRENFVGGGIYGSSLAVGSVSPLMVSGSAGSSSLTISKFVTGSSANLAGDVVADTRFQISFSYFS